MPLINRDKEHVKAMNGSDAGILCLATTRVREVFTPRIPGRGGLV